MSETSDRERAEKFFGAAHGTYVMGWIPEHLAALSSDLAAEFAAVRAPLEATIAQQAQRIETLTAAKNDAYRQRNLLAMLLASEHGGSLVAAVPSESEWTRVLLVPLRTGQISFHLHDSEVRTVLECPYIRQVDGGWDGHTDAEKWKRVRAALSGVDAESNVTASVNPGAPGQIPDPSPPTPDG
jgi:hypothetical protein